jgi:glycosyltransferase involved in cell wall biosynthesis
MRVMFWSAVFWPSIGGVQTMAGSLLVALRERGHELIVITERGTQDLPPEDEYEGITVFRLPFAAVLRDVDRLMRVRKQIIRLKCEFAIQPPGSSPFSARGREAVSHLCAERLRVPTGSSAVRLRFCSEDMSWHRRCLLTPPSSTTHNSRFPCARGRWS